MHYKCLALGLMAAVSTGILAGCPPPDINEPPQAAIVGTWFQVAWFDGDEPLEFAPEGVETRWTFEANGDFKIHGINFESGEGYSQGGIYETDYSTEPALLTLITHFVEEDGERFDLEEDDVLHMIHDFLDDGATLRFGWIFNDDMLPSSFEDARIEGIILERTALPELSQMRASTRRTIRDSRLACGISHSPRGGTCLAPARY